MTAVTEHAQQNLANEAEPPTPVLIRLACSWSTTTRWYNQDCASY